MGFLDDVFMNLGPIGRASGGKAGKVLERGTPAEGTIVGILVERATSDDTSSEPEYRYALDVPGLGRVGVRQRLNIRREEAHVGATVPVKVLAGRVVLDNGEPVGRWKMVDPPAEGVEDRWRRKERKRIDAGVASTITVLAAAQSQGLLGPSDKVDLTAQLASGEQRRLDGVRPPDYARFLVAPGAVLPVGIDKDGTRITVDWERAAS